MSCAGAPCHKCAGAYSNVLLMLANAILNCGHLILKGEWRRLFYVLKIKFYHLDLSYVSVADIGSTEERSRPYVDSGGPDLDAVLRALRISSSDCAIDIGCGKGGAMISLARCPFARVDGVDLSPELVASAEANLRRMRLLERCRLFCADATQFKDLDAYNFIYLYNPFRQTIMLRVVNNVLDSLRRKPRQLTVIYMNPVCGDLWLNAGFETIREFQGETLRTMVYTKVQF